jgi:hypothetical protein
MISAAKLGSLMTLMIGLSLKQELEENLWQFQT